MKIIPLTDKEAQGLAEARATCDRAREVMVKADLAHADCWAKVLANYSLDKGTVHVDLSDDGLYLII